jgi:excisionase family DNA binding protein
MTAEEAAKILGRKPRSVRQLAERGGLRVAARGPGNKPLFDEADVAAAKAKTPKKHSWRANLAVTPRRT